MPTQQTRLSVDYTITFEAPFHCGTGSGDGLVDRIVRRDPNGYLVVPGSTIKGAVREQCERIATLFGAATSSPHDEQAALLDLRPEVGLTARMFGSRVRRGGL